MPARSRATGSSLVELLLTLGLLGVLIAAALPSFSGLIARERVVVGANRLIALLHAARERAIVRHVQTVVCPSADGVECRSDGDWSRGWIAFEDHDEDRAHDAGEAVFRAERDGDARLAIQSSVARPSVTYQSSGRSRGSNLTIRVCASGAGSTGATGRAVVVNNAGRARIAKIFDCPA